MRVQGVIERPNYIHLCPVMTTVVLGPLVEDGLFDFNFPFPGDALDSKGRPKPGQ